MVKKCKYGHEMERFGLWSLGKLNPDGKSRLTNIKWICRTCIRKSTQKRWISDENGNSDS